ncbi:MAG: LysM peptidoglycan-binding domain-containing protein [Pseudomonadota bacterium]
MDIKQLHSTRFLHTKLVTVLIIALAGCAGSPDDEWEEESEVVETPTLVEPVTIETAAEPQAVELKADYPEKYIVVKGDTLWDISARFLEDPWLWPRLWHFNPHIANPHLIYPGDILTIIFINGKPMMQVTRNGHVITAPSTMSPEVIKSTLPPEVIKSGQKYPTVKLRPQIREEGLQDAIATISIDAIGPFLNRPRVVAKGELEQAPYVVAHTENRMMAGGGYKIYTRGLKEQELQGDYLIVRTGEVYRNPDNKGEILGYEAIYVGEARLTRFDDPSTMLVTDSSREILRGDRLLPKGDELIQHTFLPLAPEHDVNGKIISMVDGINMIGLYQVVVLNLGRQDDIIPGHVLAVNQTGKKIKDIVSGENNIQLPSERAGTVMIFRTFDRVSYALVMDSNKTINLLDQVTNP